MYAYPQNILVSVVNYILQYKNKALLIILLLHKIPFQLVYLLIDLAV